MWLQTLSWCRALPQLQRSRGFRLKIFSEKLSMPFMIDEVGIVSTRIE
jgi:hypothetical protein